ncbi:hypothetical protein L3Y34_019060 [Caenorhabditis briggsae]|uniref:Uncharacterized protein n=1 Tax=Caenorhabditis briggsae TaxID=6238 RepID=A0AAE9IVM4_CAEBR|nr:hypothetical protein L3Y34_019060 [Caenorhabditis briggsae]
MKSILSNFVKIRNIISYKNEQSKVKQPKLILKYRKLIASEATEIVKTLLQCHNLKYCRLVGPFGIKTFKKKYLQGWSQVCSNKPI